MTDRHANDPQAGGRMTIGPRPAQTEIPAGPGDAGASDVPELLERKPERHTDQAGDGGILVRLLWAVAIIFLIYVLIWE